MILRQQGAQKKTEQRAAKDTRKNNQGNCYRTHDFFSRRI